jgi:DNA primase
MLVPKELVIEAKVKFGDQAIELIRQYFNLENWENKNFKGSCPFGHSDSSPSFIWNSKNNSFHCFSCNRNFGIIDLFMKQGLTYLEAVEKLFDSVGIEYKFGERGVKTKRDYKYPVIQCSEDRTKVDEYFATRKISKETLDYCNVGQDMNGNIVWKFFDENDTLMTVKLRPARPVRKDEEKEWYLPNYDNSPILFNMNRADFSNGPLLITEGQGDCLSIIEAGYPNCVSVPGGSQNTKWIESCYDWLEKFDQIIIFSDMDEAGIKMRKEVIARLGQWRCKYVEIPEDYMTSKEIKDANAVLYKYGKQALLDLIANAQEIPISGIVDLAQVDDFNIEQEKGLYPGIKTIENIVYKFLLGSVVIVTGTRGSGKSTLLNQCFVSEALNQNMDVFYYSGELAPPVLKNWLELTMSSPEYVTMKDSFIHLINKDARKDMKCWYQNRVWVYNDTSNKSKDILDKAVSVTRKYGVSVWLLDNMTTIDIDANDNNVNQKQKDFIVELNKMAILYGVLIVLVVHPRKIMSGQELNSDDVGGSGSITNLAQYVLSIKRYSQKEKDGEKDGRGNYKVGKHPIEEDVEINILKNRFTGKIGPVKLFFEYSSYRFWNTLAELYKRYGWNKDQSPLPKKNPREDTVPDWARN